MNKWIAGALSALAVSVFVAPGDIRALAASAPCAPTYSVRRPIPPTGVRIIGDLLRLDPRTAATTTEEEDTGSGPYVRTESAAPMTVNPHAYFDALSLRGDCMVAYSLRDMDQLLFFMDQDNPEIKPWDITYDPLNDPDPRRQDAAKIVVPANEPSLPNNVRLPIPAVGAGSLFVTWDAWMGHEFAYQYTGIGHYKHFQFASPDRIWTQVNALFDRASESPGALAMFSARQMIQTGASSPIGPNVTSENPLSPYRTFAIMPEKWTRYWAYFNPVADGWFEFSMWIADEDHDAVQTIDRLLIKPNYDGGASGWQCFWLEYNTSARGLDTGFPARVSYARNVVMLRGVSNPTSLLERPLR